LLNFQVALNRFWREFFEYHGIGFADGLFLARCRVEQAQSRLENNALTRSCSKLFDGIFEVTRLGQWLASALSSDRRITIFSILSPSMGVSSTSGEAQLNSICRRSSNSLRKGEVEPRMSFIGVLSVEKMEILNDSLSSWAEFIAVIAAMCLIF